MKPLGVMLGLSCHAFFEGIAFGLTSTLNSVLTFGCAILCHKWAESLTLGIQMSKQENENKRFS